ncbi:dTDP-4-dehydrorhamnose 3,5-epimerase [Candidatus Pelagibacter sp.]|nr:dTDP-4-dehydrorhamnose 3,5-epimerase [Candidatus Pelagibacter sp.]
MKIIKTKFKDLFLYKRNTFLDNRGFFRELFLQKLVKKKFPFDVISLSKKNVIRGLHIQLKKPQGKLLTVLRGKIFDVALDCRKNSKTYGKIFTVYLSDKNNTSLYIPEGFAHGFCALENNTLLHYKCTNYRYAKSERGILWNDTKLKIKWPTKKAIISNKDKSNYSFKEFEKKYVK